MAKALIYNEVTCAIHGMKQKGMPESFRVVKVATPRSKNERKNGGCPYCKKGQT